MSTNRSLTRTTQIVALGLILISIPAIMAMDVFLTEWRVPTRIMYAIPIMVTAVLFSTRITVAVILVAILFSILDASMTGISFQTELLSIFALAIIGLLSIAWAKAQREVFTVAKERAHLYEQEQQRAKELEDAHARLLEFFAMVAHDLRNPLTTMGGYSQMLPSWGTLPPEQRERLATGIKSAVRQMTRLADDLQDASRIGTGRFDIDKELCDLVALSRELIEQRQAMFPSHRLILEARDEPLGARCDRDRILQAFGNLVDNAIKYSPEGGEVRVTPERIGDRARVAVCDQGVGIAAEDIRRLFQPYERLQRTAGIKGLGLGLYIVRGIVEAHGGTITVRSEPGKGSCFVVYLPLDDPP